MTAGQLLLALLVAMVKAGLLLALAAGLAAALRRAPARARHAVWVGALAGSLLVPALAPWVPDWRVAALKAPALSVDRVTPEAPATTNWGASSRIRSMTSGASPPAPDRLAAATTAPSRVEAPRVAERQLRRDAVTQALSALRARARGVPIPAWLLGAWLVGCAACGARLMRSLLAARRLANRALPAGPDWQRLLAETRRRAGVDRPVRLLLSAETARPMTWGWRRPVVLLPAAAGAWSAARRRVVLLHELVHVRRGDWPLRLLARLVCSVYWLNPLAWLAARRLALEQELACDEEVVALGTRPSSYARHLLAIARALGPTAGTPAHALDMARRSQMEGRLMSILDGNRRSRGGRGLAVLALAILAGLVPALAAIEPWAPNEEEVQAAQSGAPMAATPVAGTEGVARVLGELEELERRMEPFEAELEVLETDMGPVEVDLEGIETEMAPVEVELEAFEAELEPFEAQLEAIEVEMEPFQAQLEEIELALEPFEAQLEAIEVEVAPFEEELEAIEAELEPFEVRLEAIEQEMEPLSQELEELSGQLEPLALAPGEHAAEIDRISAEMRAVHERMRPLHERMAAVHEEMKPVYERMAATHREMKPVHERMAAVHEEMRPAYQRMADVHRELEPLYERMAAAHEEMRPVFERMGAAHERMAPFHERMRERHEAMEPHYRKMGEIHQRMGPLHEEMGRRHEELRRELTGLVERMLAVELAGVTAAGTDYAPVAERVVDAVSVRVDGGVLRLRSSVSELRSILDDALGARATVSEAEFAAAAERFARALSELEVEAGQARRR